MTNDTSDYFEFETDLDFDDLQDVNDTFYGEFDANLTHNGLIKHEKKRKLQSH